MIALLIKVFHEDYLVDICLYLPLISFLSFVVLTGLGPGIWAVKKETGERWGRKRKIQKRRRCCNGSW